MSHSQRRFAWRSMRVVVEALGLLFFAGTLLPSAHLLGCSERLTVLLAVTVAAAMVWLAHAVGVMLVRPESRKRDRSAPKTTLVLSGVTAAMLLTAASLITNASKDGGRGSLWSIILIIAVWSGATVVAGVSTAAEMTAHDDDGGAGAQDEGESP